METSEHGICPTCGRCRECGQAGKKAELVPDTYRVIPVVVPGVWPPYLPYVGDPPRHDWPNVVVYPPVETTITFSDSASS